MAKGDHKRAETALHDYGGPARNNTANLNNVLRGNQADFYNNYQIGKNTSFNSYDDIMNRYKSLYNQGPSQANQQAMGGYSQMASQGAGAGWNPEFRGAVSDSISGYGDFAKTGGFTDQGIQDIRARGIAPTRAVYENAQSNIDRQRSLQGGYSPNYTAATARLTRDLANSIGDQNTNVNAQIAQMVQQGRLAGLGGLSSTGQGAQGIENQMSSINANARLGGLGGLLEGSSIGSRDQENLLRGMTSLYGTTPGMLGVTGQQLLGANNDLIQGQQLSNNLDIGLIGSTQNLSQIPGDWQQGIQTGMSLLPTIGNIAGGFAGLGSPTTAVQQQKRYDWSDV